MLEVADCAGTVNSCYGTQNEQLNTHNNVIEGDIRRDMTVDTDQKYLEKVEASANMIFQLKQRDQLNNGYYYTAITYVEESLHVSSYPLLGSMGFDTGIYDGVTKMRAAALLRKIFCLRQRTKIR